MLDFSLKGLNPLFSALSYKRASRTSICKDEIKISGIFNSVYEAQATDLPFLFGLRMPDRTEE